MKPNKPAAQLLGFYGAGQPFEEQQPKYAAEDEDWRPRPQRRVLCACCIDRGDNNVS